VPASQINDAQTPHAEASILPGKKTFIVRTAMHDGVAHTADDGFIDPVIAICDDDASNPAHCLSLRRHRMIELT
jgi:hypothetical protein